MINVCSSDLIYDIRELRLKITHQTKLQRNILSQIQHI